MPLNNFDKPIIKLKQFGVKKSTICQFFPQQIIKSDR